jgi:ATP-dependent DNA helicase DinG
VNIQQIFKKEGLLSKRIPSFQVRPAQAAMAYTVSQAIQENSCLVAEAGTGTGKTLAYLIPAVLSGKKIIISTATKTLQDQLFLKDIPLVRQVLEIPFQATLLKGRSNYLCLYRLENTLGFEAGYHYRDAHALEAILRWSKNTHNGDIAEAINIPEFSILWPSVTSTVENCLSQECPKYGDCFLVKARKKAQEADMIVINHHLFWADRILKNDGFGEILPDAQVIIIDEAHQFAESATQFLGLSISSRQLEDFIQDTIVELCKESQNFSEIINQLEQFEQTVISFRLALGQESKREAWHKIFEIPSIKNGINNLKQELHHQNKILQDIALQSKGLENCYKRSLELFERLQHFLQEENGNPTVRWYETNKRGFTFNRTPMEISQEFERFRKESQSTWIFTSATLTVNGQFDHFIHTIGLADAKCQSWESPFDYAKQCLLFLPTNIPDPSTTGFNQAVIQASIPILKASQGRAFILFTSHQALQDAAQLLPDYLDYPLFIQGTQPKRILLELFKKSNNGILLGTSTFWEGVDVPGPALSCVIIDKLPFASPNDPILSARIETLRQNGQNPFISLQLPSAIITLKQGVGRLIRDPKDRGVLTLADPRLLNRSYGKMFLSSLPAIPITRNIRDVEQFFIKERELTIL